MEDEADILRKADALLRKRRPIATRDFPILTEVVDPLIPATQSLISTELETNPIDGAIHAGEVDTIRDWILEKALTHSDAIMSKWMDSSLQEEIRNLIQLSVNGLIAEVIAKVEEAVSISVRESVQKALESELRDFKIQTHLDQRS